MHVTKCATRKMLLDMRYTEYMAQHVPHYIYFPKFINLERLLNLLHQTGCHSRR